MRVAAMLIASAVALGAQTKPLEKAWALAAKGERSAAIKMGREAVKQQPGNPDARLLLGSLLVEEGSRNEAIEQLNEAVKLQPKSAEAANALGEAYKTFGDSKAALQPFGRAVALNPNFGEAQLNLGSVLLQTGDSAEAAKHLDLAIKLMGRSPDAADAHYLRARICSVMGQTQEADEHLERAVALRPDFAAAWSDLGQTRRVKLDDKGALEAFERAVKLNPQDAVAQYRLGAEYLHASAFDQALTHLRMADQLAADDQSTLNALQTALRQSGRPEEAAAIKQRLADVLHKRDQKSQAGLKALRLNNEGAELEKAGNLSEAVARYEEALRLQPEHNGIRVNYAVALLRLGRWTDGLNELRNASRSDPGNRQIETALNEALAQAPAAALPEWAKDRIVHE